MWAPWKSVHLQSNQIHSTNMYVLGQFFFFYFIWVCTVERWQEMKGERLVVTCNRDCNEDIGVCSQRLNPSNPPGAPIKKCIVFTFFLLEWRYKSWVFKFEVVVFLSVKQLTSTVHYQKKWWPTDLNNWTLTSFKMESLYRCFSPQISCW